MFLRTKLASLAICSTLALTAATHAQDGDAPATDVSAETVVATVNGTDIKLGAVLAARKTLPAQYNDVDPQTLLNGIVTQLVQQEALGQLSVDLSDAVRYQMENENRALRAGAALNSMLQGAVTEEQIQAAYEDAFSDVEAKPEFRAAHILVETEDEALALIEELDGGADFADLARQKSTGPSGPNGGDLGWFGEGMMVAPFEAAVMELEPGAVSAPVQTQFGWHVIKLIETRMQDAPPLDEMRDAILNQLESAAANKIIEDAVADAEVTTMLDGIDGAILSDDTLLAD